MGRRYDFWEHGRVIAEQWGFTDNEYNAMAERISGATDSRRTMFLLAAISHQLGEVTEQLQLLSGPARRREQVRKQREEEKRGRLYTLYRAWGICYEEWRASLERKAGPLLFQAPSRLWWHMMRHVREPLEERVENGWAPTDEESRIAAVAALLAAELPDMLCGPKTKTQVAYMEWRERLTQAPEDTNDGGT